MDSGEKGTNSVAVTIINSQREYWLSLGLNQRPVLKSAMLPTKLWGSANIELEMWPLERTKGFSNI